MTKAELRKLAIVQRKGLSDEQIEAYSLQMLAQFTSFDFSAMKAIHLFLPIAEKKEPDTFLFVDWLALHHPEIKIIVPKADFDTALMSNYVYTGKEGLIRNLYNILEPEKGELHTGDVDLVLVPMLAFDRQGYRVGYGKGFYDRFLQGIKTLKVGLSFFDPVERVTDADAYDIPLDLCITPGRIYRFK